VLIGIARKAVIERYSSLFIEAGIKITSFTFSAAVLYSALRLLSDPPSDGFLAVSPETEPEAYGESPARPILSALLDEPLERSSALAAAELRLTPEAQCMELAEMLPQPKSAPADFDLPHSALCYATALAGACFRPALRVNLLPAGLRSSNSRMILAPTVALAVILMALAAGLAAQAPYQQRRQLSLHGAEIGRFEPLAKKAEGARKAAGMARSRVQALDSFQRRTREDLDALQELTRLLEPPAWLGGLEMSGNTITINGQAEQAAPLLKLLDGSPRFRDSEFVGQIQKAEKNETFRIRMTREGVAR
jgi:Tfp pilus assembly protein PilN